jgi:hypothetical protein
VLAHYERAFALGYAPARRDVYRTLLHSLSSENRLDVLDRGVERLIELRNDALEREYGEDVEDLMRTSRSLKARADEERRAPLKKARQARQASQKSR